MRGTRASANERGRGTGHVLTVLFIAAVWATMSAAALGLVWRDGTAVPYMDDWEMVPALTGNQPVTFSFLWAQHNEHRIPLPKIIYLSLGWMTRGDLRAGMFFNTITLAVTALLMLATAAKVRGRVHFSDAFFPIAVLNLSQYENLLWGFSIQLVLASALACVVLSIVGRHGAPGARSALLLTVLLVCLALSGASGLVFLPGMAIWLGWVGWRRVRSPGLSRNRGYLSEACAGVLVILCVVYFSGYHRPAESVPPESLGQAMRGSMAFLSVSLGLAGARAWPHSGWAMAALWAATVGLVLRAWIVSPGERERAGGLLAFLGGAAIVALAVGWGRSGYGEDTILASRYVTLSLPLLCGLYLAWVAYAPRRTGLAVQTVLFLVVASLCYQNGAAGLAAGSYHQELMAPIQQAAERGMAPGEIVERFKNTPLYPDRRLLVQRLEMLRRTHMGPYRESR